MTVLLVVCLACSATRCPPGLRSVLRVFLHCALLPLPSALLLSRFTSSFLPLPSAPLLFRVTSSFPLHPPSSFPSLSFSFSFSPSLLPPVLALPVSAPFPLFSLPFPPASPFPLHYPFSIFHRISYLSPLPPRPANICCPLSCMSCLSSLLPCLPALSQLSFHLPSVIIPCPSRFPPSHYLLPFPLPLIFLVPCLSLVPPLPPPFPLADAPSARPSFFSTPSSSVSAFRPYRRCRLFVLGRYLARWRGFTPSRCMSPSFSLCN